jgi:hypothetical protein
MAGSYNTTGYRNSDGIAVVQGQAAVTQATSITTAVTCNAYSGVVTTVSQTIAAGAEATFTVNNSKVAATDCVGVVIKDHTSAGTFAASISDVSAGSFDIRLTNLDASAAGNNVLVLNFIVHKAEA